MSDYAKILGLWLFLAVALTGQWSRWGEMQGYADACPMLVTPDSVVTEPDTLRGELVEVELSADWWEYTEKGSHQWPTSKGWICVYNRGRP